MRASAKFTIGDKLQGGLRKALECSSSDLIGGKAIKFHWSCAGGLFPVGYPAKAWPDINYDLVPIIKVVRTS